MQNKSGKKWCRRWFEHDKHLPAKEVETGRGRKDCSTSLAFIVQRSTFNHSSCKSASFGPWEYSCGLKKEEWKCSVICLNKGEGESLICVLGLESISPVWMGRLVLEGVPQKERMYARFLGVLGPISHFLPFLYFYQSFMFCRVIFLWCVTARVRATSCSGTISPILPSIVFLSVCCCL